MATLTKVTDDRRMATLTRVTDDGLPPGPRMPVPLQLLGFWYRRIPFLETCRARYGDTFTLYLRPRNPSAPFVILCRPEDLKEMFLTPADVLHAGDGSSELQKYFGPGGLAYMEETDHLTRRKLINRSMHGPAVEHIAATVRSIAEREVASWPLNVATPLYSRIFRFTLEVMRQVSFGSAPDRRLDELVSLVDEMMKFNFKPGSMIELQHLSPGMVRLLEAIRPVGLHRFLQLRARCDRIIYEIIDERRRAGGGGLDLVGMLLASPREDGEPFTLQQVRDEVMTTFLAGTATTAATISWGLEQLSREHAARERLMAEIDAGDGDAYLTATFREILRRKPPLPIIIPRLVQKPVDIGGRRYEPGVRLVGSSYLVHHDPATYPEPYAFRPERFLDEGPGTYTWIPFGGGRRRCLGHRIAEIEVKAVLSEALRQYDLRPQRDVAPERAASHLVTMYPEHGAAVALRRRAS
jgi:cytochrome P450 family 135